MGRKVDEALSLDDETPQKGASSGLLVAIVPPVCRCPVFCGHRGAGVDTGALGWANKVTIGSQATL